MPFTGRMIGLSITAMSIIFWLFYITLYPGHLLADHQGILVLILFLYGNLMILLGYIYDKTKLYSLILKQKNAQLTEHQKNMKHIFDTLDASIFLADMEKNTLTVSKGMEKIYGLSQEKFHTSPLIWKEMVHPDDQAITNSHHQMVMAGTPNKVEYRIMKPNGEIRWVSDQTTPFVNSTGRVTKLTGIILDITDTKQAEAQIEYMAYHDELTGLPNRYFLTHYLEKVISHHKEAGQSFAIMFLDLDRFKLINDAMGHYTGDKLLQQAAERLKQVANQGSGTIIRLGGDEFIFLLEKTISADAANIARKVNQQFELPFLIDREEYFTTASIGISMFPNDGQDGETLIKHADVAMYDAKESGANTYQFWNQKPDHTLYNKIQLENKLRKAIDYNELLLHYQPQIDLKTGRIAGIEALLRWQHPDFGLVPPSDFIPLAEDTGIIIPIGKWVLETACTQTKRWQEFTPGLKVAVNISPVQFKDAGFVDSVQQILSKTGLSPESLELEITESVMQNIDESMKVLQKLKQIGVKIFIDDFGTGYSCLGLLHQLPIDFIKIDRSFIHQLQHHADKASIVCSIIQLGRNLHVKLIAEGVEYDEQMRFLCHEKCDYAQGYIFSPPLPVIELEEFLMSEPDILQKSVQDYAHKC